MGEPLFRITSKQAGMINFLLPIFLTLIGLLHPQPYVFYRHLTKFFIGICAIVFPSAIIVYMLVTKFGMRIQQHKEYKPKYLKEIWVSVQCFYTASCLAAWPFSFEELGYPTIWTWKIEEQTVGKNIPLNILQMIIFFLFIDFQAYVKHRSLHSRELFGFHKDHHQFYDPSCFASFAVSPVEALLTFGPVLFANIAVIKLYAPFNFACMIFMSTLNLYYHAGYTIDFLEKTLPKLFINTALFHNRHHEKTVVHFGELLTLWDYICNTGETYYNQKEDDNLSIWKTMNNRIEERKKMENEQKLR